MARIDDMRWRWPRLRLKSRNDDGFYSFISYTNREHEVRQIRPLIDKYVEAIRERGVEYFPVYLDRFYIPLGHPNLEEHLEGAIRDSDFTTAFLSPGYFTSSYCRFEFWTSMTLATREWAKRFPHGVLAIVWKTWDNGIEPSVIGSDQELCLWGENVRPWSTNTCERGEWYYCDSGEGEWIEWRHFGGNWRPLPRVRLVYIDRQYYQFLNRLGSYWGADLLSNIADDLADATISFLDEMYS